MSEATTTPQDLEALLEDISSAREHQHPWEVLDPDDLVTALNRLKELEAEKRRDALMLDSAKSTPTGFDIQMHAGGPKTEETLIFIADSMRSALDEYDAQNYLEMKLRASDHKNYVMTLQRQGERLPRTRPGKPQSAAPRPQRRCWPLYGRVWPTPLRALRGRAQRRTGKHGR